MATLREQVELTARRVLDEYRRSGALPGPFRARLHDKYGAWPAWSQIKAEAPEWAADFLSEIDAGQKPRVAGR